MPQEKIQQELYNLVKISTKYIIKFPRDPMQKMKKHITSTKLGITGSSKTIITGTDSMSLQYVIQQRLIIGNSKLWVSKSENLRKW